MRKALLLFSIIISASGLAVAQCYTCPATYVTGGSPLPCDTSNKLNWASWTQVTASSASAVISSDIELSITKPAADLSSTSGMYAGYLFPPSYTVPVNSTALLNNLSGKMTICFSRPVFNPEIAFSSIGQYGLTVQINTSSCFEVVWQGVEMTYPSDTSLTGTEGYCIIKFPGMHTCLTLDFLASEYYCNLAFAISDTACQKTSSVAICGEPGSSTTLYAGGADNYSWSPAEGLDSTSGSTVIASPLTTTKYYVTGTNANNCSSIDSITVTVKPSPVVSISGDTIFCTGTHTTLDAGGGYSLYSWNSSGGNAETLVASSTGNYAVTVTNNTGCTGSASTNVHAISPPSFIPFPDTTICYGHSVILSVPGNNILSYQWTPSAGLSCVDCPSPQASPSGITTYIVRVNPGSNCTASDTITVSVDSLSQPILSANREIFCSGDSAQICAPSGFVSYQWNNYGGNDSCTEVTLAGNYYVMVMDNYGCTAESNRVAISVYPVPSVSIESYDGKLTSYNANSYQWYKDGDLLDGDTSSEIITTGRGNYSVVIIDSNGCSTVSNPVYITGIDELGIDGVKIYPNPSTAGSWELTIDSKLLGSNLQVYDGGGKIVFQSTIGNIHSLITMDVERGIYLVRISSPKVNIIRKFIQL